MPSSRRRVATLTLLVIVVIYVLQAGNFALVLQTVTPQSGEIGRNVVQTVESAPSTSEGANFLKQTDAPPRKAVKWPPAQVLIASTYFPGWFLHALTSSFHALLSLAFRFPQARCRLE